ncbi:MAG TPA: hypothetical protein VFQ05_15600 [Candidatus Eisenbacteria bacterium]|nr:hypothetical protein [Candidatus Eisenbacteria bacterium]
MLMAILAVAVVMRLQVAASIPILFGPGDPGIYLQMGRAVLAHGFPRVDFIHHFLTAPEAISHVEDYYEPAFGYLVAGAMAIGGGKTAAAPLLSVAASTGAIVGTWALTRRQSAIGALIAASVAAFEPWSVLYGGLLMKEATVSVVLLAFIAIAQRLMTSGRSARAIGVWLAVATLGAGLVQYELIPILGLATLATLIIRRSKSVLMYTATLAVLVAAFGAMTWLTIGVPFTAKTAFFLGRPPGDPDHTRVLSSATSLPEVLRRLVPVDYLAISALTLWYPLLAALAIIGLRRLAGVERTLIATVAVALFYLHGIAHDLWARDFIPLTVLLSRPVGLALSDPRRLGRPAVLAIMATFASLLFLAPPVLGWLAMHTHFALPGQTLWPRLAWASLASAVVGFLVWVMARRGPRSWSRFVMPPALAALLLWGFWVQLPYTRLDTNPQFPDYEIERASRERVCLWMKATVPAGPVIARIPAETALYSGSPAIVMPESLRIGTLERLAARYGARYLLVDPWSVSLDPWISGLDFVGERERWRLYRFPNSPLNSR